MHHPKSAKLFEVRALEEGVFVSAHQEMSYRRVNTVGFCVCRQASACSSGVSDVGYEPPLYILVLIRLPLYHDDRYRTTGIHSLYAAQLDLRQFFQQSCVDLGHGLFSIRDRLHCSNILAQAVIAL